MLHIPPGKISVRFQGEGTNAGRQRRRCGCTSVATGTMMMQIRSDDLFLAGRTRAICGGEGRRARLAVPGHKAVLCRTTDRQCPDTIGIAVTIAVIVVPAAVSGRPYEDRTLTVATLIVF